MRTSLLYSGLEAVAYNCNRKNSDLLLFEIGRIYSKQDGLDFRYAEQKQLALFVSGKRFPLNHFGANEKTDFFTLKAITEKILQRFNLTSYLIKEAEHTESEFCLEYYIGKKLISNISKINKTTLKKCDVQQDVYAALFYTEELTNLYNPDKLKYKEVSKFPSVRRDLALLLDKSIKYDQVKEVAEKTERKLLKAVNLFDVYESEKTGNKKSYAVSFIFQDEQNTLTDKDITKTMDKLIKAYTEQLGAEIR
jgi:phenylalanyl-tRNA synthetase beta chain